MNRKKSETSKGEKKGLSPRSITHIHRNLCKALDYAGDNGLIQKNPAKKAQLPKLRKYSPEVFDHKTILKLLDLLKGTELEAPVALAGLAGLRRGEALGLKWEDVNFKEKEISIKRQLAITTKGVSLALPKTDESIRIIKKEFLPGFSLLTVFNILYHSILL